MKLLKFLEKQKQTWFLIAFSFIFFLLRFPSFFEPYWYGDEGIYEVVAKAIRSGRELYTGVWDNKPPLLYLIYSIFSGDQFWAKFISALVGVVSIIVFFFLAKKLFDKEKKNNAVIIATGLFMLLFATPFLEGNIANAENFMLLPIIAGSLLVLKAVSSVKTHDKTQIMNLKFLFFGGLLMGLAFLIKIVALFDTAAFGLFILIEGYKNLKQLRTLIKELISFTSGFALPIILTFIYFLIKGSLSAFLEATFFSGVGYVGYSNNFIVPEGLLILKLLILAGLVIFFFSRRLKIEKEEIFIYLWVTFAIFDMLFSGRPYTHYILTTIASVSLLVGLIFIRGASKRFLTLVLLLYIVLIGKIFSVFGNVPKTFSYYGNFFAFLSQSESVESYYKFFDKISPRDYSLSQFINMHKLPNDTVFVWGNSPQIYMLTNSLPPGRFVVAYHMNFTKDAYWETRQTLIKTQPKFIVILPNQSTMPYSLVNYTQAYSVDGAAVYEKNF